MKAKNILAIFALVGILISCHKENDREYQSKGLILGTDVRMCACCGGWFIQIDSVRYDFNSLPARSGINLETDPMPLNVKLDWQLVTRVACPRILITRIKKEQP